QLDQLNWIARVFGVSRDADADGNVMSALLFAGAATDGRELVLFDRGSHALSRDQSLRVIRIEQEGRELFSAKSRADVTGAQRFFDYRANFFKRFAAGKMTV